MSAPGTQQSIQHTKSSDETPHELSKRMQTVLFFAMALIFAVNMIGTTLPAPLYPIYQDSMGFSNLTVTIIFASYAVGVIGTLIATGPWSDQIGRRPVLAAGLVFSALSAVTFLLADSLPLLIAGRVLSGMSAGLFTAAATVAVVEMAPAKWRDQAPIIATFANIGGLGLGALLAGLVAEYLPLPLRLVFILNLLLIAAAAIALWLAPETVSRPNQPRLRIQSLGLPAGVAGVFVPAAIASFAGFAVLGLFTSVAPAVAGTILNISNHAVVGLIIFLAFFASLAGQMLQIRIRPSARLPTACAALIAGAGCIGVAVGYASLPALIAGALIAGAGQGCAFGAGLKSVAAASPAGQRGEVAALFFIVAYVALSLPVVGLGLAIQTLGLRNAGVMFSCIIAALALLSLASLYAVRRSQFQALDT